MDKEIVYCCGDGKYKIKGQAVLSGTDMTFIFAGGQLHHIGAVSICHYSKEEQKVILDTVVMKGHKDHFLSKKIAEDCAHRFHNVVCVTVGIHVDNATNDEIELLSRNCMDCYKGLIQMIIERQGA
ncbi:MAG: hypothetical protein ACI4ES_14905 [Roseburia sp.]